MKTWVRKTLSVGVLTAGALLVAPTAAQAEIGMVSWDNDGIANGTQVALPIQAPINVCGTGVGALLGLGAGEALCSNGAAHDVNVDDDADAMSAFSADQKKNKKAKQHESDRTEGAWMLSGDNDGIANGTQVYAPIQVPVNICGTGVGALLGFGVGSAACDNGAVHDVNVESASRTEGAFIGSWDNDGILNGTQVYAPVQVPVNLCGTGIAVVGLAAGQALCSNGAAHDVNVESARTEGAFLGSFDNDGILNGTQIYAPIQVPINVCGTGVGILGLGFGQAVCSNGAAHDVNTESASRTEGLAMVTGDNDGIANGTQVALPIQVPVNVCGTGVGALLGLGAGSAACSNGAAWDVNDEDEPGSSYYESKQEFLPVAGGLTSGLPVLGGSGLPALGGNFAKGSQANIAGIDPTSFLAGLPTA